MRPGLHPQKSRFTDMGYGLGLGFFSNFPGHFGVRTYALDAILGFCLQVQVATWLVSVCLFVLPRYPVFLGHHHHSQSLTCLPCCHSTYSAVPLYPLLAKATYCSYFKPLPLLLLLPAANPLSSLLILLRQSFAPPHNSIASEPTQVAASSELLFQFSPASFQWLFIQRWKVVCDFFVWTGGRSPNSG